MIIGLTRKIIIISITTAILTFLLHIDLKSENKTKEENIGEKEVYYPDDKEKFSLILLFDSPPSYNDILRRASSLGLEKAFELLPFSEKKKDDIKKRKKIDPSDFVEKFSIDSRSEKPDGIEIVVSLIFNMKRLVRIISTEEPVEPKYSVDCSYIEPIIKSVLEEFQISAKIKCELNERKGDFIQPSYLAIKIKGEISSKGKMEKVDFSKTFLFLSTPPYDEIREEIENYILQKFGKTKKIDEYRISVIIKKEKLNELISSLRKKAFIYSVIPFYIIKDGDKVKAEMVIKYFSDIPQQILSSMIKDLIKKSEGEIVN
ncbi:MAG: hypothetical protein ACO2PO_04860 [Candidatus Calescibacterium sp.]